MQRVLAGALAVMALVSCAVLGHLAVIEVGREVITLRTPMQDGTTRETRLWIVDDGDVAWLHSAGKDWAARFEGSPVVEVSRAEGLYHYRATAVPGPHPRVHELLRAKYGLADRWVRLIGPDNQETLAVRLSPLDDASER